MSCCYELFFERATIDWSDLGDAAAFSLPLCWDVDLAGADAGTLMVAIHSITLQDAGSSAQLTMKAVTPGCDADDEEDFIGPEIFRVELGQASAGDAIAIPLPAELPRLGRVFLDLNQADTATGQSIELSVWLRSGAGGHA